ncbi:hypothetical protein [Robertkochia flava]|uniref:hypothetical protein n=1 Tax=Robertkochia flava TaxID=3447986 RepID=UPI00293D3D17|nr:hypothetical protein [Robertkochia marina]
MRKLQILFICSFLCQSLLFAQKDMSGVTAGEKGETSNEISKLNDEKVLMAEADTIKALTLKKGGKYVLPDNPFAKEVDSLWLQQFYGSGLYDTIYKDIASMEF